MQIDANADSGWDAVCSSVSVQKPEKTAFLIKAFGSVSGWDDLR